MNHQRSGQAGNWERPTQSVLPPKEQAEQLAAVCPVQPRLSAQTRTNQGRRGDGFPTPHRASRPSQDLFEPCLNGSARSGSSKQNLGSRGTPQEKQLSYGVPTKPQISFHPEAPRRCQGFVLVSLLLCQKPPKFQQQQWQKGKRNLSTFHPACVSQDESKTSLGSASCHGRAPASVRQSGEKHAQKDDKPSPRLCSKPCGSGLLFSQAGRSHWSPTETHHCAVKSTNSLEKRSAGSWGEGSSTTCLSCWKGVPQDSYGKRRMASSIWGRRQDYMRHRDERDPTQPDYLGLCSQLTFRMKTLFPYKPFSIWVT